MSWFPLRKPPKNKYLTQKRLASLENHQNMNTSKTPTTWFLTKPPKMSTSPKIGKNTDPIFGLTRPSVATSVPSSGLFTDVEFPASDESIGGVKGGGLDGGRFRARCQAVVGASRSPSSALSHPFFGWEGSPTKIDYSKKGTLILSSLLEDLGLLTRVLSRFDPPIWDTQTLVTSPQFNQYHPIMQPMDLELLRIPRTG